MTQKPKRKLKNIDFSEDTSHIALVSKHQGGPASGANYSLVLKNVDNPSPEFIQKMQAIQVTMTIPEFLKTFFMLWEDEAELLATMMGYVEPPEDEAGEAKDEMNKWVEERFTSFNIIKSLHEAKSLPDALSKLTEQDYLDILTDQVEIEKALNAFTKEKQSQVDTSTNVENTKVEASASKKKTTKEKQMTQETEMVEKAKFVEIQKQFEDQKVALEKALEQINKIEQEKKEAIVKSKTDAVKAVVKDEKQATVVVKAALALEDQADFDALVEVFKSMNALIEKSGLFQEQGVSAEAAEDKPGETKLMKALKARHQAKQ